MIVNNLSPFLKTINQLFHIEMGFQTSGCLFGSALTDNWVAARSDLDLLVLIPEEEIELFGKKIKEWQSIPANPLLDGFAIFLSGNVLMAKRLEEFDKTAQRFDESIWLIDVWNIKNQSKYLFGIDLKTILPEISIRELQIWAIKNIESFWIPNISKGLSHLDESSEYKIPLSSLVWTASGVARILMLARGDICSSKREALRWLALERPEIRETINLFREEYDKPDDIAMTLSTKQAFTLGRVYLHLLQEAK
jgi:hypothetical protein